MKNEVKKWRRKQDLSQMGVAVKSGVSVSILSAIERWNYVPGPVVRARIANALGVSETDLWPTLKDSRSAAEPMSHL